MDGVRCGAFSIQGCAGLAADKGTAAATPVTILVDLATARAIAEFIAGSAEAVPR